ncbi:MAG TPA: cytochrome c3 family protein, partial [Coriobacteriia bacterium]|nr:cytochrome c3 family protein [Coriobacteriia bacterium]
MGGKRESVVVQHLRSARDTDVAGDGARRSSGAASARSRVAVLVLATLLVLAMPVLALAAESPHGAYDPTVDPDDLDVTTDKCSQCHRPHQASVSQDLLSVEPTTGVVTQTVLCFKCHGYAGPAESNAQATFETALPTGHRVEDSTGTPEPDLTNVCADCHEPHGEALGLPRAEINGWTVDRDTDPNSWCRGCHDPDSNDADAEGLTPDANWSGVTGDAYYDQIFSSRDASSYPTFGTFRGWDAYETNSAHSSILASASVVIQGSPERTAERGVGDCLWCHASHRAPSEYDNLVGEFGPSSPGDHGAGVCFVSGACHDISDGYGSGHLVSSPTAVLAVGSPLPCYECHNAHGSRNDNAMLGQDTLGQNLDPSTPEGEAAFCYTCHLSSDSYGWNSFSSPAA